jgi:hypothetical protein
MNSSDSLNLIMDKFQLNRFVEECEWDASIETDIVIVNWNDDLNDDYDKFWINYIIDSDYHELLEGLIDNILDEILTTINQIENLNNNFEIKKYYVLLLKKLLKKFNLFEKITDSCNDAFNETYNMPPGVRMPVIGGI